MKTKWNTDVFIGSFMFGIVACMTPLLAPIHEYGHYAMSTNAEIVSWTRCANIDLTVTAITAGYIVEFVAVLLMHLFCRTMGNRGHKVAQGLAGGTFGYLNCLIFWACFSKDFLVGMPSIDYSIEATIAGWWIMTVPIIIFLWIVWKQQLKTT